MIERKKDISPSTVARKAASAFLVLGEAGGTENVGGSLDCEDDAFDDGETVICVCRREKVGSSLLNRVHMAPLVRVPRTRYVVFGFDP